MIEALYFVGIAFWVLLAAAIVILVATVVRIGRSFEQISLTLTEIADLMKSRSQ